MSSSHGTRKSCSSCSDRMHSLPAGSQQTISQGDLWHWGAAHHVIKRWPDLFPFAFLQHCCGTRRCCSQPEGHAMLWMALPMEKYLEIGSKVSQRRRKHFSQNPKCHRVGTNTVFPSIDLQLGSPLPADPDCLTQTHSHWLDWTVVFSPPGRAEKGGEKSTSSSWDSFKTKGRAEVLSDCRQL